MEALVRYPWPGNIRELQNVIERSVVIHRKGNLAITKCCLSHGAVLRSTSATSPSFRRSAMEDRKMIDAALTEAHGRVSGPSGAAAILGIPPSTLESRLKSMNINKYSFKTVEQSSPRASRNHEEIELL
jgi:DNA-binding NtrC family response regulator